MSNNIYRVRLEYRYTPRSTFRGEEVFAVTAPNALRAVQKAAAEMKKRDKKNTFHDVVSCERLAQNVL